MNEVKTIFISIFEGVEAKNIMRTPILSTLLKDSNIKIVLFTKSEERVVYYKQQFPDLRLTYEIIKVPPPTGLDRFFASLKFTLLRTETTLLKRRMTYEESGNRIRFAIGLLLNKFLARPFWRKIIRKLDYLLVKDKLFDPYFEKYQPDCIFLAHLFDEPEIAMLRAAKKRNIFSVGLVNSWDKATARGIMRLLPDKLIVFNDIVKAEVIAHDDMKGEDIFVAGLPQYDIYSSHTLSSREEFFKKIRLDPQKRLIVYAPMGSSFSDVDWLMIDLIEDLVTTQKIKNAQVLVRFQPNDFIDALELKKRPHLHYDYPGQRFSTKRGIDWDMDEVDLSHLADTLYHASLIVSFASSICIDALAYDKPSININFEPAGKRSLRKSPTSYYKMIHYQNVIKSGGIVMADSESELIDKANQLLDNQGRNKALRARLKREQWQFEDGRSGERIGKFILNNLER